MATSVSPLDSRQSPSDIAQANKHFSMKIALLCIPDKQQSRTGCWVLLHMFLNSKKEAAAAQKQEE